MAALDVITLSQAKDWLQIDQSDSYYNETITELIESAVSWAEVYTGYYLYAREVEYVSEGCQMSIYDYPINSMVVENAGGDEVYYKETKRPLKLLINTGEGNVVKLNVGFENVSDIPKQFMTACKKYITYHFENRDVYGMELPVDIQGILNQLRRGIF